VNNVDDPTVLKKMLTTPPVKKIDLHFPLGLEVSARNLKGVTIKDALDAIHKQFKKKVGQPLLSSCTIANHARLTTSLMLHTSKASNGIPRNRGPDSRYIRPEKVLQWARRKRRRRVAMNELSISQHNRPQLESTPLPP